MGTYARFVYISRISTSTKFDKRNSFTVCSSQRDRNLRHLDRNSDVDIPDINQLDPKRQLRLRICCQSDRSGFLLDVEYWRQLASSKTIGRALIWILNVRGKLRTIRKSGLKTEIHCCRPLEGGANADIVRQRSSQLKDTLNLYACVRYRKGEKLLSILQRIRLVRRSDSGLKF